MKRMMLVIATIQSLACIGQEITTDSLKKLLDTRPTEDSLRVVYLCQYAYRMFTINPVEMERRTAEALRVAEKLQNPDALSRAYQSKAVVLQKLNNNMPGALSYYQRSIAAEPADSASLFSNYLSIGTLFYDQKQLERAMDYSRKALVVRPSNRKGEEIVLVNI